MRKKKQIAVVTWNDKIIMLSISSRSGSRGKTHLQHLIGPYHTTRIGYGGLLRLDYCIHFERIYYKGGKGCRVIYNLLKKPYASNAVRTKTHYMKRGILSALTRGMSLKILLRRLPKAGAINLPPHRYDYRFVAVCLIRPNTKILDIDYRCQDPLF